MNKLVKVGIMAITVTVILVMSRVTVQADEEKYYDDPSDLYSEWAMQDSYPENFTGAWIQEGKYYIGMTDDDAGHAEAEAVVASLRNSNSVTIVYQKYKYRYLKTVMQELNAEIGEHGVMKIAIQEDMNCIKVWLSEYATKQEQTKTREKIEKKFGDAIIVMTETHNYDTPTSNEKKSSSHTARYLALFASLVIGVGAIVIMSTSRVRVPAEGSMLTTGEDEKGVKSLTEQIKEYSEKTTKQFDAIMIEEIETLYKE